MSKLYKLKNYKLILVIYVLILNTLGVFLVGSASPGDQKKQIIGMVSGIVIMVILSLIDYSFILRFSWIIYLLAVGLLALVLVAGDSSKGAQRWFEIGGIRFQPSELVKILLILFFAYYFMKYEEKINTVRVIVSSFVLLAIPLFLIYKQPNLSTMIVITLVFCALLFMAGLNYKLVVGVLIVCIPVGLIGMTLIIQDKIPFIHAYQLGRIRQTDLLWCRCADWFSDFCQYRCGERASAKYRCNTSVCQLRTYIIMVFVYRYRACLKCRASAEKILTTGGPTT